MKPPLKLVPKQENPFWKNLSDLGTGLLLSPFTLAISANILGRETVRLVQQTGFHWIGLVGAILLMGTTMIWMAGQK